VDATCEHVFVTSQGRPYPRFKRALQSGNATLAWSAALEVGRLELDDALALCLLQAGGDGGRYDAAALRWHSRFCAETRGVTTAEAQLLLAALAALPHDGGGTAAVTLLGVLRRHRLDRCATAVDQWVERHGPR
jgi:hypothetical protein